MKIIDLKEKHPAIYKRALECQKEQGNEPNDELDILCKRKKGNFNFGNTKECDIWLDVNDGNFDPFYTFHNIPNPEKQKGVKEIWVHMLNSISYKDNEIVFNNKECKKGCNCIEIGEFKNGGEPVKNYACLKPCDNNLEKTKLSSPTFTEQDMVELKPLFKKSFKAGIKCCKEHPDNSDYDNIHFDRIFNTILQQFKNGKV